MSAGTTSGRRIALCYFAPETKDYVPMDVGYVVAGIRAARPDHAEIEILRLSYAYRDTEDARREDMRRDCAAIIALRPDAVFLFVENVLWSKVFALGRAKKISAEIRRLDQRVFIGIQSYKIQPPQVTHLFEHDLADCVVVGDPEAVLLKVEEIIDRKPVPGVMFAGDVPGPICRNDACAAGNLDDELDAIPSPYLDHVFDDFLRQRQAARSGRFRAFLASSRGCSFGCFYCFRSVKFDRVRLFSVKRFFDELEYLLTGFGVTEFFVLDDAFLYSKARLRAFVEEFRIRRARDPRLERVRLFMMARPESIDAEVVALLSELQTAWIQIGLQTVHPDLQRYMNRKVRVEQFRCIAAWLRERGIRALPGRHHGIAGGLHRGVRTRAITYALSLEPAFMQVKQFYLNPNTLFFVEKDRYGIEVEASERDFDAPYVVQAAGVGDTVLRAGDGLRD